ncbi:MAG TPA: peptide ABC transporter substrate-binding protein [Sulfurospirillum sp. UBA11407]|nr:MAG TPA: peptide ABC transporter substrate-binding protein [Sulfurospirillum sp. UBA11407]
MKTLTLLLFTCKLLLASTLHMSISASPARINPILSTDSVSSEITRWIFNSLVTYDKNANIKTELAKSYRFLDETTLEFKLRDDVRWSDGEKFSAKDVVFTYETIISPDIYTPYASGFLHVKSVEAVDEYTLLIKYKYPYFKALEIWMMEILPYHKLKDEKNLMSAKFNQSPIGTGPYTLEKFSISSDISLKANKDYFIHKPNIDKIVYHFVPDNAAEFLMLKSGKLDVGSLSPLQLERQLDESFKEQFNIYEDIAHSYNYIGFNLRLSKFQDPKIREALSLAIDRQEIVDILYLGHGQACHGPFMPGTGAYNESVKSPKQDIKEAKRLLREAGYDEQNPFAFTLSTNTGSRGAYLAQILQYQLKKAGIIVNLRVMEWQAFLNTVISPRNFEAVLMGWSLGLKPDAYSIWHSESNKKGGFNFIGYKNEEVDGLIKKAEQIVNKEEFDKIYQKIFALIAKDNPYLFLVIPNSITAVNKKISPVTPSLIGVMHNAIEWTKE